MFPFAAIMMAWTAPAELWFEPKVFQVTDGVNGEISIIFDRDIDFDFNGGFTAEIRDRNGAVACPVSDFNLRYRADSSLPHPITLEWWMGHDGCNRLPAGSYVLSTTWRIDAFGVFRKYTDTVADTFVVYGG